MTILNTYIKGWGLAIKHLKLWGFLYVINFLFAIIISFPIFRFLNAKLSHSMALDKMYEQFDFTVYNDIVNEYGDVVDFLMNQGLVTGFLFLLIAIFFTGGILTVFRRRTMPFRFASFWTGGANFYGRIFGLTILFLFLHGVLLFIFFSLFSFLIAGGVDRFHSEAAIYQRAMIIFPFYLFFATLGWMVQDYTKVIMVEKDSSLFRSLGQGIRFVVKNFPTTFLLYFLNLLTFAFVFYLYWRTPTANSIGLALLIGQLFLIFRIGMKLLNLGTATLWYDSKTSA